MHHLPIWFSQIPALVGSYQDHQGIKQTSVCPQTARTQITSFAKFSLFFAYTVPAYCLLALLHQLLLQNRSKWNISATESLLNIGVKYWEWKVMLWNVLILLQQNNEIYLHNKFITKALFISNKWQVALVKLNPSCALVLRQVDEQRSASWYSFKYCFVLGGSESV